MSCAVRSVLRTLVVGAAAMLALGGAALAQGASKQLEDFRQQIQARWMAQDPAGAHRLAEQALQLALREFGPEHWQTAHQYTWIAGTAEAKGDYALADRYYAEDVRLSEKVYGPGSAQVANALDRQAKARLKSGQPDAAEPLFQRARELNQRGAGMVPAIGAVAQANLGDVALARGQWAAAQASYREAIQLLAREKENVLLRFHDRPLGGFRDMFAGLCQASWQLASLPPADAGGADKPALLKETFAAAQVASQTAAASALSKMTARLGASDSALGQRIRRMQDSGNRLVALSQESSKLDADWYAALNADPAYSAANEESTAASIAHSRDVAPIEKRQGALMRRLMASREQCPPPPEPLKAGCEGAERERTAISTEYDELSRAARKITEKSTAIHARVEALRKALPGYAQYSRRREALIAERQRSDTDAREAWAEINKAFPDYVALSDPQPLAIAEVQSLLKGDEALVAFLVGSSKSFVWAVTREGAEWAQIDAGHQELSGHVSALRNYLGSDFDLSRAHALYKLVLGPVASVLRGKRHLMVVPAGPLTSIPFQLLVTAPPGKPSGPGALRQAPWLIKTHALSVLPSVQSLQALRKLAPANAATKPFFGVGDPVLEGPGKQGGELTPLPETADELIAVGKMLGASPDAIYLREAASEPRLRTASLKDYRVVHFATHGLLAGDLPGLDEPALVLTPPPVANPADDGLLTASEIATLSLNADWVVLSACNTAGSAGGSGAEDLSGLARAFFFAGARTLLVSHWAVYSQAAIELTTTTFKELAAKPQLGRAEAFRTAMLDLIARGKPPSYWAPFVVVGDGAR